MALPVWQATVTDDTGDVLPGAQIDVVIESTGTDATLFSNRAGTTSLSNPFFADSEGFAQFYTEPGAYRITATASGGGTTRTWRYVSLFDFDANVIGSGDLYGRDSILGTVSETAGVPTGAVIESGSNSDGEYTKYADGRVIATALVTVNFNGDIDLDSRRAFDPPVTFLYDFTAVDGGVGSSANVTTLDSAGRDFGNGLIQNFELAGADPGNWVVATLDQATADSGDNNVSLMAIGRWFN